MFPVSTIVQVIEQKFGDLDLCRIKVNITIVVVKNMRICANIRIFVFKYKRNITVKLQNDKNLKNTKNNGSAL